jgi:NADPH:quinone reductase
MQAAWYTRNGSARDVLIVGELPTPEPSRGEVRVRLHASGINPSDVKSRARRPLEWERVVPHSDGAGVIEQVGPGVTREVGERVWVWNGQWLRPLGTAAEFIVVPEYQAQALPAGTSFAQGACLGIPALTALEAIRLSGELKQRNVLVIGAGSAVGHYVTQLAVRAGARVIGTAGNEARRAHAIAAGASDVIDYKRQSVADGVKALTDGLGVDVIIDMDFSTTAALLPHKVLKPHGKLVCYGSNTTAEQPIDFRALLWSSLEIKCFLVYDLPPQARQHGLQEINQLLQAGALEHPVAGSFALADIASAHEMVEAGSKLGTVVLAI